MFRRNTGRWLTGVLLVPVFLAAGSTFVQPAFAQGEIKRQVKNKVSPVYPDLARRMSITGTVKVQVVVMPNGAVKSLKVLGGHPLLINAATDAVKQWKFEPAAEESTGFVQVNFQPQN